MLSKMWEEWVLDVSFDMPVFVPYERDTDTIVIGLNVARATSPGKLVGVIHEGGQEAVDEWIANHPKWAEEYGYRENGEPLVGHVSILREAGNDDIRVDDRHIVVVLYGRSQLRNDSETAKPRVFRVCDLNDTTCCGHCNVLFPSSMTTQSFAK